MQINQLELITQLQQIIRDQISFVEMLQSKDEKELNWRIHDASWSILECIEHLKLYNEFYIPAIQSAIQKAKPSSNEIFKSGWLGNYFANSMLPKEKLNKMKTFKDKNPINSKLTLEVLNEFENQLQILSKLLDDAKSSNLNKIKVNISISKWIKLKLGDTFRFVIYHQIRHFKQIEKVNLAFRTS